MRKRKGLLVSVLSVCLMLTAACSSGNSENSGANSNPKSNNGGQNKPVTEEKPPVDEGPKIDMNGETLKILTWEPAPTDETPEGALRLERWKEVEEKYKVKIDWEVVPWGESINMLTNSALSGEPVADIVLLDYYMAIPGIKDGLFMPIDGFFDFNDPKWPKGLKDWSTFEGHQYNFVANLYNASGLYYNKSILKREGLPDPHDLVAEDKWDWNALLDIAKKVTKDTDGDGVIDQWGIANGPGNLLRMLVFSNGGSFVTQKDGKYVFANEDSKVIEAARFFNDLYNVHKVASLPPAADFDYLYYEDAQNKFISGKSAFFTGEVWEGGTRKEMTDEQGFVYFPKGPQKQDAWQGSIVNYAAYYMPANVKRAQEKAKIWEEMQLWDYKEQSNRAAAEKQNLADEKDIETILDVANYAEPFYLPLTGTGNDIPFKIATGIAHNGESPETAMEKIKQIAQDGIDSNLNKK